MRTNHVPCVFGFSWTLIALVGSWAMQVPIQTRGDELVDTHPQSPVRISIKVYKVPADSGIARDFDEGKLELPLEKRPRPQRQEGGELEILTAGQISAVYVPDGEANYTVGVNAPVFESVNNSAQRSVSYGSYGLVGKLSGQWYDGREGMNLDLNLQMGEEQTTYLLDLDQTMTLGKARVFELKSSAPARDREEERELQGARVLAVVELSEVAPDAGAAPADTPSNRVARMELVIMSVSCPAEKVADLLTSRLIAGDPGEKELLQRLGHYGDPTVNVRLATLADLSQEGEMLIGERLPVIREMRTRDGKKIPSATYESIGCIFSFGPASWTRQDSALRCTLPVRLELSGIHPSGVKTEDMSVALPSFSEFTLEQALPLTAGRPFCHVWVNAPQTNQKEPMATVTVARLVVSPE